MITTTDIANILYKDCMALGIEIQQDGNIPDGKITKERVVIHVKEQTPERIWRKGFVEVNILVPDVSGKAQLIRLNELERMAVKLLKRSGNYDGTFYSYDIASISILNEKELDAHYVNARVLFKALNTIE